MTPTEFATHVRFMTRTTSVTFTDAEILALMKLRQDEIARAILRADEDILLIPQTSNLVANQREYPFPTDIIARIKKVVAKFDGTNWIPLTEIDISDVTVPLETEANVTASFNSLQYEKTNPQGARYDIRRKSLYLLSGTISAVTNGLRLYLSTYPQTITSLSSSIDLSVDPSDTTHGIPRSLHEIWARGVIIDYKSSREKPIPLTERELSYQMDLDKAIETLRHGNLDREVIGHLPPASDRGNDGFDY